MPRLSTFICKGDPLSREGKRRGNIGRHRLRFIFKIEEKKTRHNGDVLKEVSSPLRADITTKGGRPMTVHFVLNPWAVSFLPLVRAGTFLRLLHPRLRFHRRSRRAHMKERKLRNGELLRTRRATCRMNTTPATGELNVWNNFAFFSPRAPLTLLYYRRIS